jgi:3'(2'), 5'-bisphosphate nucleotidase
MLSRTFPQDPIAGEESSAAVREASSKETLDRIIELASEALTADLGLGDDSTWGIGQPNCSMLSIAEVMMVVQRVVRSADPLALYSYCTSLNPFCIDGTKGSLRGEQYAVCFALTVDARVQLGVIGCLNLLVDASKPDGPRWCLFVATRE